MTEQEDKMDASTVKKLVNRIKACTFLPYLNKCDWSIDVLSSIEEFISTDRQMICLFYENNILKATFCIPDARTDSIMWFLKTPDSEHTNLNTSNFLKLISFGKMDTQVEKTMFLLLDSLYSPFIFSWSASEKDQFFEQYRAVIQELCSLRYKFLGMPSIYIPTIVGKFDETSKSISEETLKVLENILNVYTLEIQKCLMDTERVPTRCEYMMEHIVDEIGYWKTRLTNLRFITTLLSYKSVEEILTILKQHQSILVHSFNNALDEIKAAKVEAKSNLNYLQILWDPVMSLYNVQSPNDVLTRLPDIFVKFIFIFEESEYYNKWSDISRLYEYLGNQIVFICRKTIKMSELFSGNTESVLNKLRVSMNCCENYISIYTKVITAIDFLYFYHCLIAHQNI
ncbi:dynein gamma chain, flagellar outer arm-like [Acyrthosiphon pisum]|uniref:Dynein heavy chain tail domain-containing protein n=1 Tax=Acyrthosiphon pisum TaxID=7029 RepID=A0A8R2D2V3_ACYPI|nr:dynein gamma chain, flagellar outer arm-like [Acyrthosiphon pisum]